MAELEAILSRLLVPDNAVIQQATQELKEVYKHPSVVPSLCECLVRSMSAEVRQYASVLLRRRLVKMWKHLQENEKSSIKQHVLGALDREEEHPVRRSLAHLVAVIASQELSAGKWDELYLYVEQNCVSSEPRQREVAMLLLSNLLESVPEPFQPKLKALLSVFANALQDTSSKHVPYYTIKCLTAMVEFVGDDELPAFRSLIPAVITVLRELVLEDEDHACQAMELFDELLECEVAILAPHIANVVSFLLEVGADGNLGDDVRVKALSLVSSVVVAKKKTISKPETLQKVLMSVLGVLVQGVDSAEGGEEEGEEDLDQEMDAKTPYSSATKLLDTLALHISPKVIYPAVVQLIQPWFTNESSKHRKAAILAVAVLCEGCSDHIKETGQVQALLEIAYRGLQDKDIMVRNASFFAIGQFSDHLQPEINKYASDILPVLLSHLQQVGGAASGSVHTSRQGATKAFYALDMFCESLGKDVVQYLGSLMEKVVHIYQTAEDVTVKELVVSTFGALATAAEDDFLPYFPKVVEILKECLVLKSQPAALDMLHGQVIDTLGVLARTVGQQHFMPLAQECLQLGMNGMQSEDPDLRGAVYGMLAALAAVLKEDIGGHLDPIVIRMLEALQSDEGVKVHYDEPCMGGLFDFDEIEDEDQDDEEEDLDDVAAIKGVTVENAFLEEKEDACNALGEIAAQTGVAFLSHFDDVYREITQLMDHSSANIRKASVTSLSQVCKAWLVHWERMSGEERAELTILLNATLQVVMASATTETDQTTAFAFLEALEGILRACKRKPQMDGKTTKELLQGIQDFLTKQTVCQETEDGGEIEEDEAEVARLLTEAAGSLVPPLVSLIGPEQIWPQITAFFANLTKSLGPNSPVSERSYVLGTLGELVDAVGLHAVQFAGSVELFLKYLVDEDSEVRNNAAFSVGVLAANAATALEVHYPNILQQLFAAVDKEENGRCIDNIIAAVCRMITAKPEAVPLDQVLPVVIQKLPLREDEEEYKTVYRVLRDLLRVRHHIVLSSLPVLLKVLAHDASKLCDNESKLLWREIVQFLSTECLEQFQTASANLTPDELQVLTATLQ